MRIEKMRELLEHTAIDHVYYRTYDPLVRCVGREYTAHRGAQIAMLVAGGRLKWTPDVAQAMYWSFNSRIERVWNMDNASAMFDTDTGAWNRCERPLFSRRYRLTGKPDYVVRGPAGVIPVEVKSGAAPQQPYSAHVLQLAAYCLLVEEQESRTVPYGIIKYADKAFEIDYTPALRAQVVDTIEAMRRGLRADDMAAKDMRHMARSHDEPRRCLGCGYRDQCDQRLA
jgi:CRISPR-associated exonuclease Cas4